MKHYILLIIVSVLGISCEKQYVEIVPTVHLEQISSPTSLNLRALSVFNSNVFLVAGDSGTIYKTVNGGATWIDHSLNENYNINRIILFNEDKVLVGTNKGVFLIEKESENWIQVLDGYIYDIDFISHNIGFVVLPGNLHNIYKTVDGGKTWIDKSPFWNRIDGLTTVSMISKDTVMIAGNGIVYSTTDGGNSWNKKDFYDDNLIARKIHYFSYDDGYLVGSSRVSNYPAKELFVHMASTSAYGGDYTTDYAFDLYGIDFYDGEGVVVGENSVILPYEKKDDGYVFWEHMLSQNGTTIPFFYKDVQFIGRRSFIAVGEKGIITRFTY